MQGMFQNCSSLTSLDVSGFDTSIVTDMSFMFNDCSSLTSLDVSGFDTSKAKNISNMFVGCNKISLLDLSGFNLQSITSGTFSLTNPTYTTTLYAPYNLQSGVKITFAGSGVMYRKGYSVEVTELTSENTSKSKDDKYIFVTQDLNEFTIKFVDEDGTTVLQESTVKYGDMPEFTNE